MTTPFNPVLQGIVPTSTIVPTDDDLFIPYFTRTYESLAQGINSKDSSFFAIAVTSTATNIPTLASYGSFIVCVSGVDSTLPTLTASLCKADATAAGSIATIGSQVGTGSWAGNALSITSTASNFQIAHDRAGATGNFNIRIIGTQSPT